LRQSPPLSLDSTSKWPKPRVCQLLIARIIGVHSIGSHSRRIEASPRIYHHDGTRTRILRASPVRNRTIQSNNSWSTLRTIGRIHWDDLCNKNLHSWLRCAHLIDELAVRSQYSVWGDITPHIVSAEVHHHYVGFSRGEPIDKEVLVRNVGGEVTALVVDQYLVLWVRTRKRRTWPSFSPS
jgi:hypothetical protein